MMKVMRTAMASHSRTFESLKAAEDFLMAGGFRLLPWTCDWVNDDRGIDAGVYPIAGDSKYEVRFDICAQDIPESMRHIRIAPA